MGPYRHTQQARLFGLQRVLRLMRRFEGQPYAPPLEQLAAEYGVTARTIRRDLELLESVGIDLPIWRPGEQPWREIAHADKKSA